MANIERLRWILNVIFKSIPYCVGMVGGDRFQPLFLLKYRRVAIMINIERLGWVLNVSFKYTLIVWVWGRGIGFDLFFVNISLGV